MGEARRRKLQGQGVAGLSGMNGDVTNEQKAFLERLSAWDIASPWQSPPATEQEGEATEVMLYLVYTLSLWNVVGGTSEKRVLELFDLADSASPSLLAGTPGLAGISLINAAKHRATLPELACQNALTLSGFYLSCTETLSAVRDKGTVRGHWFIMLYQLKDGTHTVRPFHAPDPAGRKLTAKEHMNLIVDVVARDLHSRSSGLAERIAEGGGLKMAGELERRVSPAGR